MKDIKKVVLTIAAALAAYQPSISDVFARKAARFGSPATKNRNRMRGPGYTRPRHSKAKRKIRNKMARQSRRINRKRAA